MCVVKGYVSPQVQFEVRLPLKGWAQRYLQTGCGGLCGNLSIQAPQRACPTLQRGEFVTASTDMRHHGPGGTWGASDPQGSRPVVATLQPGSELSWSRVYVPSSPRGPLMGGMYAADMLRSLAYWRPLALGWDLSQFQFTMATLEGLMPMHGLNDAIDPDLSALARRGGKLLMWHGWSDPDVSPLNSVAYAQAVTDRMGAQATRGVLRLLLIPGLYHCGGGDGLTSLDVLTPLMAWVEGGRAPDHIVASRPDADAQAEKGRAIYAWPTTSVLSRGQDPERPASWRPGPPLAVPAKLYATWAGARLFVSGYEQECGFDGPTFACRAKR
jgi:Tannase and feruloyl esterase